MFSSYLAYVRDVSIIERQVASRDPKLMEAVRKKWERFVENS